VAKQKDAARFVSQELILGRLHGFLNKHSASLGKHLSKISQYAEVASYNATIDYYSSMKYKCTAVNLFSNGFHYKLMPTGDPDKFSYFVIEKGKERFFVFSNTSIESAHVSGLYFTADIVVAKDKAGRTLPESIAETGKKRTVYVVPNDKLCTFLEVKNLQAFPELLYNFSGLLYEMMPDIFMSKVSRLKRTHLAPSLICSFAGSSYASFVRGKLMSRWHINIFLDFLKGGKLSEDLAGDKIRLISSNRRKL